jgi:hypothetical protein
MTVARWVAINEFTTRVTGVTKLNVNGVERQEILARCKPGIPARLTREPANRHDPFAIAVHVAAGQIGYIPADLADEMAPLLDAGERRYTAVLSDVSTSENEDGESIYRSELTITERIERPETRLSIFGILFELLRSLVALPVTALRFVSRGAGPCLRAVDRLLRRASRDDAVLLLVFRVAAGLLFAGIVFGLLRWVVLSALGLISQAIAAVTGD